MSLAPTNPGLVETMAMYLIAELTGIRDAEALRRYAMDVQPLMARHGGRILAMSSRGEETIEGEPAGEARIHAIHVWDSRSGFDTFWSSAEYQPLKALRRSACETRITVFEVNNAVDAT